MGHSVMLGTTMNLVRDARGGRSFESYGEDPLSTARWAPLTAGDAQRAASWDCQALLLQQRGALTGLLPL